MSILWEHIGDHEGSWMIGTTPDGRSVFEIMRRIHADSKGESYPSYGLWAWGVPPGGGEKTMFHVQSDLFITPLIRRAEAAHEAARRPAAKGSVN